MINDRSNNLTYPLDIDRTLDVSELTGVVWHLTNNSSPARVYTYPRKGIVTASNLVNVGDSFTNVYVNDSPNDFTIATEATYGDPIYGNPVVPAGGYLVIRYVVGVGIFVI